MSAPIAIYEWQGWSGYMLPALLPEAIRLTADPLDSPDQILGRIPDDLAGFAFHLNCTRTANFPARREHLVRQLRERGIAVLNEQVMDISKRHLQAMCQQLGMAALTTTRQEGSARDLVIVKSDLNYAGYGEKRLSSDQSIALGLSISPSPITDIKDYRVMPRGDVPAKWWKNPMLAIERYIDNSWGRKYRTYFGGNRHLISVTYDYNQIKKYSSAYRVDEYLTDEETLRRAGHSILPASFQIGAARLIRHLGMDFGALDFVEDEQGDCYAIDINSTSYGSGINPEAQQHLRSGLLEKLSCLDATSL